MSKNIKISKESIIDAGVMIVRESGYEKLNVRCIAKILNCSVQPIYYQFKNISELKEEIQNKIMDIYRGFMLNMKEGEPHYKQLGVNYINFAKEEPMLFKIIFMSNTDWPAFKFLKSDQSYQLVTKYCKEATNVNDLNEVDKFHLKMWIFTHGIATLVATNTVVFSDREISDLLSSQFKTMMEEKK